MDQNNPSLTIQQLADLIASDISSKVTPAQHQQLRTVQTMVDHLYPFSTTPGMNSLVQPQKEQLLGELSQFGHWLEDTFIDPGLIKDGAQALGVISTALNSGSPMNSALNSASSSILPFFFQLAGKILGLG